MVEMGTQLDVSEDIECGQQGYYYFNMLIGNDDSVYHTAHKFDDADAKPGGKSGATQPRRCTALVGYAPLGGKRTVIRSV